MIAAADLDLVHIVTPDDAHVPDALLAIDRGLAVLCEKPLAVSVADAEMLASRASERGVRTKMGFTLRYSPAVMRLREIVAHGELGRLRTLQAFQQNGQFLDPAKPFHWKMDGARTGGGAIVEYGIHTLDLARWIMGEATRVVATSRTQVAERPDGDGSRRAVTVDDSTAWLMEFEGGATGMLHAGWSTIGRGPGIELRVFGDRGAARAVLSDDLPGGEGLWLATADDQRFLPVEIPDRFSQGLPLEWPWWRRFNHALIRDFVREIQGEATPSATFDDGLAAQRLLEAVIRSTAEDRWVEIA
jgi:predicted dehydrogenase